MSIVCKSFPRSRLFNIINHRKRAAVSEMYIENNDYISAFMEATFDLGSAYRIGFNKKFLPIGITLFKWTVKVMIERT